MILFGHRGARNEAPENTLTGFRHALGAGITAFEFDVHLSADDQLVVIHDSTVDRTTNGSGAVAAMTVAELARLDARSIFPQWPEPASVPTLTEVLDLIAGAEHMELEIKTDRPDRLRRVAGQVLAAIRRYDIAGRVTVTSFDPVALEAVARLAPQQPLGFIAKFETGDDLATALRLGATRCAIPLKTGSRDRVQEAQAAGMRVTGWQGNTRDDIETLLAWGVECITSDYPTLARSVLREARALP
ncbi:MAG TPA: glycerophosphodiester phosphodiesterase family protein [Casimicrobiaceae bacterium]|jgi:glycerophosphoryl diester phosphodiesterase|nr:glycerophosphodiester phosphodiesterase family protein [Casimicrobiaceae bacterium]